MTAFNQKLLRGVQGGGFLEKSPPGGLYIALAVGYHMKSDQYFKQVYDNGTANYTVEVGYWLIRNLAVGIKLNYLHKKGKTLLLQSETSLRQIPVMGYLKAGFGLGRGWRGYAALGFGYLFFKEESYIGVIEDSHPGWGLESGLEYSFTKNLYLLCAVGFQSFKKTFSGLSETQQLGGVDIRVGIGISVF
jgi:opacity protein-like surface antigen